MSGLGSQTVAERVFDEVLTQRIPGRAARYFAPDHVLYDSLSDPNNPPQGGPQDIEAFADRWHGIFSSLAFTVEAVTTDVVNGVDVEVVQWKAEGVLNPDQCAGPDGEGRFVDFTGLAFMKLQGGMFVETWIYYNHADLLRKLWGLCTQIRYFCFPPWQCWK